MRHRMGGKGVDGKERERRRSLRCLGMTAHRSVSLVPAWEAENRQR